MIKKITLASAALLLALGLAAQTYTGGVRGTVVSRADRQPVADAVPDPHVELVPTAFTFAEFSAALRHVYTYALGPRGI